MSLATLFMASLLGSLHCAGMCGGFAAYCAGAGTRSYTTSTAYSFGRLITYLLLGAFAGAFGQKVDSVLSQSGVSNVLAIIVGVLLIVWGTRKLLALAPGVSISEESVKPSLHKRLLSSVVNLSPVPRSLCVGLLSTLLPCAWLYAFVALAAASGSSLQGMLMMFVFWLGTLPIFITLGAASQRILKRWGAQVPALTASLLIASGIFCILGHTGLIGLHAHHHHSALPSTEESQDHHHHHHDMQP